MYTQSAEGRNAAYIHFTNRLFSTLGVDWPANFQAPGQPSAAWGPGRGAVFVRRGDLGWIFGISPNQRSECGYILTVDESVPTHTRVGVSLVPTLLTRSAVQGAVLISRAAMVQRISRKPVGIGHSSREEVAPPAPTCGVGMGS